MKHPEGVAVRVTGDTAEIAGGHGPRTRRTEVRGWVRPLTEQATQTWPRSRRPWPELSGSVRNVEERRGLWPRSERGGAGGRQAGGPGADEQEEGFPEEVAPGR